MAHFVEADRAVKDHSRIIGYSVYKNNYANRIKAFSSNRKGGWQAALDAANLLRDVMNGKKPYSPSDAEVNAYIARLAADDIAAGIE